jgi:cell division protein FtsI (penicillin-binding protein 3)
MAVIYVGFVLFLGVVAARLVQLQVSPAPALKNLALRQLQRTGKNAPYRLPILDRNGEELAISVPASSIFVHPKLVRHKKRTARILSGMLGGSPEKWLKKIQSPKPFVWLERQISIETASKIAKRNLPGVFIEAENKRLYPNGTLAAHVLEFTDIDGNGLSGIELKLNEDLLREEPRFGLLRDGRGKPSYVGRQILDEAKLRKGIYLTLDRRLQNLLEEELERSMEESHARSAMGVILHPVTGEILALAQRPTFDPAAANRATPEALTNGLVSNLLEPGSTLKVLFAAQAIEQGLLKRESILDCEGGKYRVGDKTFSEAHAHPFRQLSLEKVIRFSSNIGAVKVAQTLGASRFAATVDKFGLTSKTGVDLPGEACAAKRPDKFWTPIHLATAGFGQGISATPLQVTASFLPFANGGFLPRPHLVLRSEESKNEPSKRVLSTKTVEAMRAILTSVTEEEGGTGLRARVPQVRVAGKTGTAQKYEKDAGYQSGKYFSSFIGFLPAQSPELLIGVMLDEPAKEFYASEVAAPLFKRVATRALPLIRNQPGQVVTDYGPFATVSPTAPSGLSEAGEHLWVMPDLKGVSVRDALRLLGTKLDRLQVSGAGYLTNQEPSPGQVVHEKTPIRLSFHPPG